mgnify:CR=1 FL=1
MTPEIAQENQLQTIELTIEEAKKNVERMEALDRLHNSPDFKLVLLEGFLEKEALRLVRAKAFPSIRNDEERQKFINDRLSAIAEIHSWFNQINQEGAASAAAMDDYEQTREEILQEMQTGVEVI